MYDFLLNPEEQELKREVRRFARDEITSEFLRKMDKNEITMASWAAGAVEPGDLYSGMSRFPRKT